MSCPPDPYNVKKVNRCQYLKRTSWKPYIFLSINIFKSHPVDRSMVQQFTEWYFLPTGMVQIITKSKLYLANGLVLDLLLIRLSINQQAPTFYISI